jgi:hypothetical protein
MFSLFTIITQKTMLITKIVKKKAKKIVYTKEEVGYLLKIASINEIL